MSPMAQLALQSKRNLGGDTIVVRHVLSGC